MAVGGGAVCGAVGVAQEHVQWRGQKWQQGQWSQTLERDPSLCTSLGAQKTPLLHEWCRGAHRSIEPARPSLFVLAQTRRCPTAHLHSQPSAISHWRAVCEANWRKGRWTLVSCNSSARYDSYRMRRCLVGNRSSLDDNCGNWLAANGWFALPTEHTPRVNSNLAMLVEKKPYRGPVVSPPPGAGTRASTSSASLRDRET